MKIICLIESLGSGGAERQLTLLATLLKRERYAVEVWTYYPNDFYKQVLEEGNVTYRYISSAHSKIKRIPVLYNELRKCKPDVVISYLNTASIVACIIKGLGLNYKLIVSERNTTRRLSFRERCKFLLYRFADYIVPNSFTQADLIKKRFPVLEAKVKVITNFVDTEKFKPSETGQFSIGNCRIIVVGRVVPQKNALLFVRAIEGVVRKGYNVNVQWYGDYDKESSEYYQNVVDEISMYGLENVFKINPATPLIEKKYIESDLFCLPSVYEGFSNVLCEAMSCGIPIVCSDICDNPSIVEEEENGFLFNPLSVEDMTNAIVRFLNLDYNTKCRMSQKNREKALLSFSSDVFIEKYKNLI